MLKIWNKHFVNHLTHLKYLPQIVNIFTNIQTPRKTTFTCSVAGFSNELSLIYGIAKDRDLAHANLNFVQNVRHSEFNTSFNVTVIRISVYFYVCKIVVYLVFYIFCIKIWSTTQIISYSLCFNHTFGT